MFFCCAGLYAQTTFYRGTDATGRFVRTAITNVGEIASATAFSAQSRLRAASAGPEVKRVVLPQPRHLTPPKKGTAAVTRTAVAVSAFGSPTPASLAVDPNAGALSVLGLTHFDQRNANNGNQFSVEPPSPDLAAANGWVLQGVNNAIQIYSNSGAPMLPKTLSTNELFKVAPAIDRISGDNGVYPTDMRLFYDHAIDRWFVVQRAQDYDLVGNPLNSSHLYMAVSQTGNPTGAYNIYTMNTTNSSRPGCPCYSDFPQIGADQYGVYLSVDEYDTSFGFFVGVRIFAIAKASLVANAPSPKMQEIVVPRFTGFEATVRPAMTPPGAVYATARGGVQFFLSTQSLGFGDNRFGLWALTNTASLNTTPDLTLMQTVVPGLPYTFPDLAVQRPGPLPYGSTLFPPGQLAFIHGGRDSRVLSLVYAAGRLYAAFGTEAIDKNGKRLVAGAWAVLFPSLRGLELAAPVWRSGYLMVTNNNVLRPAVAVTAQGQGAIAFTLLGPDYFPSAAYVPITDFTPGTTSRIAALGVAPQDGFSGYDGAGAFAGIARWGDYSGAVAAPDGSVWMTMEYIPNAPRTELANWGTRLVRYGQ